MTVWVTVVVTVTVRGGGGVVRLVTVLTGPRAAVVFVAVIVCVIVLVDPHPLAAIDTTRTAIVARLIRLLCLKRLATPSASQEAQCAARHRFEIFIHEGRSVSGGVDWGARSVGRPLAVLESINAVHSNAFEAVLSILLSLGVRAVFTSVKTLLLAPYQGVRVPA